MLQKSFHRLSGVLALGILASFSPILSAETVIATTETAGTVSEFSPDALVIRTESDPAPVRYVVGREVTYVDDAGVPVAAEMVRSGLPVTVHYVRDGDRVIARRVVVHRTRVTAPPIVEERRVVTPAPVIEERRVVTPAPVIEERRTVVTPAPVLEQRTTTTTTTTRER